MHCQNSSAYKIQMDRTLNIKHFNCWHVTVLPLTSTPNHCASHSSMSIKTEILCTRLVKNWFKNEEMIIFPELLNSNHGTTLNLTSLHRTAPTAFCQASFTFIKTSVPRVRTCKRKRNWTSTAKLSFNFQHDLVVKWQIFKHVPHCNKSPIWNRMTTWSVCNESISCSKL